jgi:hypothetical protein
MTQPVRQITADVLLIRPAAFGYNRETAATNTFQQPPSGNPTALQPSAAAEFDGLVAALREAGVRALVFDDSIEPDTPDALFPNNWVSFHADGTVVLYPLAASNRRPERRGDIIEELGAQHGFYIRRVLDLSPLEQRGMYLEGTGSLVLDHRNRIGYAALSLRTHPQGLAEFGRQMDFEIVSFTAHDELGRSIYHTNVLMSIGERFAVICTEAISDAGERRTIMQRLRSGGRQVIEISMAQMQSFGGNILQLATGDGGSVVAMSTTARQGFSHAQRAMLAESGTLVSVPVPTIESAGGGSVRCMLAEIFLPRASASRPLQNC